MMVRLFSRDAVAKFPCTCGSLPGIYRSLDLDETDGWMECESCHNAVQILAYAKTKRVPVYQMADCNLLVPLSKKR